MGCRTRQSQRRYPMPIGARTDSVQIMWRGQRGRSKVSGHLYEGARREVVAMS